mmetsp:Transcript_14945/g.25449  ORF Transcript_14945/g.25449 Transcript_14945/m.25449 type:complete len:134 (-) Transcript_14945:92-493(-)
MYNTMYGQNLGQQSNQNMPSGQQYSLTNPVHIKIEDQTGNGGSEISGPKRQFQQTSQKFGAVKASHGVAPGVGYNVLASGQSTSTNKKQAGNGGSGMATQLGTGVQRKRSNMVVGSSNNNRSQQTNTNNSMVD